MKRDEDSAAGDLVKFSFLHSFGDDGRLEQSELAFLEEIALRDHDVDDHERAVLATIFARVSPETVRPDVWVEIERFKERFRIA